MGAFVNHMILERSTLRSIPGEKWPVRSRSALGADGVQQCLQRRELVGVIERQHAAGECADMHLIDSRNAFQCVRA